MKANVKKFYLALLLFVLGYGYGFAQCPSYQVMYTPTKTVVFYGNIFESSIAEVVEPAVCINNTKAAIYQVHRGMLNGSCFTAQFHIYGPACIRVTVPEEDGIVVNGKRLIDSYHIFQDGHFDIFLDVSNYENFNIEVHYECSVDVRNDRVQMTSF